MTPMERIRAKVEEVRKDHYVIISAPSARGTLAHLSDIDVCSCGAKGPTGKPCDAIQGWEAVLKLAEVRDSLADVHARLHANASATANAGEGDLGSVEAATCLDAEAFGVRRSVTMLDAVLAEVAGEK